MDEEIYEKIIAKKGFSQLPREDVKRAFVHFEKRQVSDEEKIRLTRELLHKIFGVFASGKLLSPKDKDIEWILRKHVSTRERLPYYKEIYERLLGNETSVIDLGAGINGFSYEFFPQKVNYVAVEAVGQLVNLMNNYFKRKKLNARAINVSLFELEKIKKLIKAQLGKRIVFLFKVLDSLEMLERDYSKKLLKEIAPFANKIIVSFATRSIGKRKSFNANRKWLLDFIEKEFKILDDFEVGGERYLVFSK